MGQGLSGPRMGVLHPWHCESTLPSSLWNPAPGDGTPTTLPSGSSQRAPTADVGSRGSQHRDGLRWEPGPHPGLRTLRGSQSGPPPLEGRPHGGAEALEGDRFTAAEFQHRCSLSGPWESSSTCLHLKIILRSRGGRCKAIGLPWMLHRSGYNTEDVFKPEVAPYWVSGCELVN